jgi:demethylmenaquinone methyltransferase / 2-methoxy-6-polyprenyl-1,4-benzoquinol methylase
VTDEKNGIRSKQSRQVREMFAGIATRYDFLNHLLSGNVDRRWRRAVVIRLQKVLPPRALVLDVACGTGDLAFALARKTDARVVATDFCRPMLKIAALKAAAGLFEVPFVEGDALTLPFGDMEFDAVTIAFGLRNLASVKVGLEELKRVLRPGGCALILEFSKPVVPMFRGLFGFYFRRVLPFVGGILSGSRKAYEYLPESVSRFPDQRELSELMSGAGFENVEYENLTGGIAALHVGTRSLAARL